MRIGTRSSGDAAQVLRRSQRDPVWFARHVLGVHPWSRQREILEAVRDSRMTSVRSCHGVGKTFIAASVVLWFLLSFPRSRVITTATTWKQIEKLLWHEIGQLHQRARFPLGGDCLTTALKLDDGRYAIGLSSKPEEAEAFAGHHAPHLLQVFDEASGVHPAIYEAAEGHLTSAGAKRLLIGNPTRSQGEFYDSHHRDRASYRRVTISYLDTPAFTGEKVPESVAAALLSREWVEDKRRKWGVGSPLWRIRVEGEFASTADTTVIGLGDVEDAQGRELSADPTRQRVVITCDVARFGSDETVIATRIGDRVRIVDTYIGKPTTETAGRVLAELRRYPAVHTRVVVDDDGVGGGVTDMLRERLAGTGITVTPFNGGATALQPDDYPNRRSELWFTMADRLPDLDLDEDDQLAADLTAPEYRFDSHGRRVVERKEETKKRLGRSPDRGDAALLTLVPAIDMTPIVVTTPVRARDALGGQELTDQDWLTRPM